MSFHETCVKKSHVCCSAVATRADSRAYDAVYLALSASKTNLTSRSPAWNVSERIVNPARLRAAGFANSASMAATRAASHSLAANAAC